MPIGTDFEIQNDKDIRYIGAAHGATGAGYYTGLEFHQWAQGLADDAAASGDDFLDITRDTPTDKSFETIISIINGYNIDDTAAEHLYNCSIIQSNGDVIYDGITILAAEGCHVEIVQNGALITNDFWNSTPFGLSSEGLNRDVANGISARFMVKVRTAGADIDGRKLLCQTREWGKTYSAFKVNGTSRGVNPAALLFVDDSNNTTVVGTVAGWTTIANLSEGYNGIDVNNDGGDEYYYSEWNRDTYSINQFFERMKWLSRRGSASTLYGLNGELFRGISHEIAYSALTGTFDDSNPVSWSGAAVGTGQILADNSSNKMWVQILTGAAPASTCSLSQTVPDAASATAGTIVERQIPDTINLPFCGSSTGTALTGAYGFGVEAVDLSAADKVYDLTNTLRQAPNYVTFTFGGLVSGEDYVLAGPRGYRFEYDTEAAGPFTEGETLTFATPAGTAKLAELRDMGTYGEMVIGPILSGVVPVDNSTISGGGSGATAVVNGAVSNSIDKRQLTLNGALSGGAVVSVVVNEAIPGDTPSTGTIRIRRASGRYSRHPYSAWVAGTKTFTITSANFSTDNAPNGGNVYISYLDVLADATSEAFTSIYVADRSLFLRVRDGGGSPIKTFESTGSLGSAGGSATAVRTSDA